MKASDTSDLVIDHKDAWDLAHFKRENSNMARCYIDAVNVLRELHGALQQAWAERTLPASVIPGSLAQRATAIVEKVENAP